MIYEIYSNQLPMAIENGCKIVIISSDSNKILISGTNLSDLNVINQYSENELNGILSDPLWKQPCVDCEI